MSGKRRAIAEGQGRRGEWQAAWFLRLKGWRIIAQRVKTPRGEIDLVARRGRTVVFVEVKWRSRAEDLAFALDEYRLRRVVAAAEAVVHRYAANGEDVRIDAILLSPWRWPVVMENAAQG